MRINKYLSDHGVCSRREADRLILEKKVRINGQLAKLGDRVSKEDRVEIQNKTISHRSSKKVLLAYNKPVGVITTTDARSQDNIIKKLNYPVRVFPIGRLDVNTSGLILLTNEGSLVNKILKAKNKIEKEYLVSVDKTINADFLNRLEGGIKLDGRKTLPCKYTRLGDKDFSLILIEGRNRQIRRMCAALGFEVKKLCRVRIGPFKLGKLLPGEYRQITFDKIDSLLEKNDKNQNLY